jgi:hypothetical protein
MANYRHTEADGVGIDTTGPLATLRTEGRETVSVSVEADVSSDFALEVDFGDGVWVEWQTYSASSVADSVTVAAERVRVVNNTAQTAGDTADAKVGAS